MSKMSDKLCYIFAKNNNILNIIACLTAVKSLKHECTEIIYSFLFAVFAVQHQQITCSDCKSLHTAGIFK